MEFTQVMVKFMVLISISMLVMLIAIFRIRVIVSRIIVVSP